MNNTISIKEIFSDVTLGKIQQLLDEHTPQDGTGVRRSFLLKKSGLIQSLVDIGSLPECVLEMRDLTKEEFEQFKAGKKLPANFPFPPEEELPADPGRDLLARYYDWYKEIQSILDFAADLLITPISLGKMISNFESRRGPLGGICRITAESPSKKKAKSEESEWSDKGLPPDFIDKLQTTLDKLIPVGSLNSITAKALAQHMGLKLELASKISDAIRVNKITGFISKQRKGILRSTKETEKKSPEQKISEKKLTEEVNNDFQNLSFDSPESSEEENLTLSSENEEMDEKNNSEPDDSFEEVIKEPLPITNT